MMHDGHVKTHFDRLSPQDEELLCSLGQEAREFVHKNVFDLVCLLNFDTNADAVHARLEQDALGFVARNCEGIQ